jgi:hypothetical protein
MGCDAETGDIRKILPLHFYGGDDPDIGGAGSEGICTG